jgi:hypothetical protein
LFLSIYQNLNEITAFAYLSFNQQELAACKAITSSGYAINSEVYLKNNTVRVIYCQLPGVVLMTARKISVAIK